MTDKAKLISAMKCWIGDPKVDCTKCAYYDPHGNCVREIIKDALELLKDQPEIVRCKDCKYYRYYGPDSYILSECTLEITDGPIPTFFCECGERRDGDV